MRVTLTPAVLVVILASEVAAIISARKAVPGKRVPGEN
jgi:hypothetical protein